MVLFEVLINENIHVPVEALRIVSFDCRLYLWVDLSELAQNVIALFEKPKIGDLKLPILKY